MSDDAYELRMGSRLPNDMSTHGREIADLIHARMPLSSVRIYLQTARTYLLSVRQKGRETLASMTIRMSSRPDLRAAAFVEWLGSEAVASAIDAADRHRRTPLMVERVLPVMLHECGDGRYFHTMMINVTRRRDILHPSLETKPWDPARLDFGVELQTNAKGEPVVRCHKQPFSIDGLRLRLNGARLLVPADEVSGRLLDEVVDDRRIAGCGLIVGRWIKQTGTPGSDHHLIDLASDPMPIAEAAALVDELRTRNDIRGVGSMRTPAWRHVPGYDPAPGVRPEDARLCNHSDRNEQETMMAMVSIPAPAEPRIDPVAAALLAEHGLENAYREKLARERNDRQEEARNPFCMQFDQQGAGGRADVLTFNMTPWLREAPADDIGRVIRAIFGRMDMDRSVLMRMAERCRHHMAGDMCGSTTGLEVFTTPNRHDEARMVEVLHAVRPDVGAAADRIMRFARTSRELEFGRMWTEFQETALAA